MPDRHGVGGLRVAEAQVGQILPRQCVKLDAALIDELHDERGREELRDRADLKQRVGRCLNAGAHVDDAARDRAHVVAQHDGERRACDVVSLAPRVEPLLQEFGGRHVRHRYVVPARAGTVATRAPFVDGAGRPRLRP